MTIPTRALGAFALPLTMSLATACVLDSSEEGVSSSSPQGSWPNAPTLSDVPCEDGYAAEFSCESVDLLAFVDRSDLGGFGSLNDIWGWTDPQSGSEYALVGRDDGTAFVDISAPTSPLYLGKLPTHSTSSKWRDIKVYDHYAYIVSEAGGHGLQIFDLRELRDVSEPSEFSATSHYDGFATAHNIAINEESGFAYAVGSDTCKRGMHMLDLSDPVAPEFAGCYSGPVDEDGDTELGFAEKYADSSGEFTGCFGAADAPGAEGSFVGPEHDGDYTHDTQCVIYRGPHSEYQGREICFNSDGAPDGGFFTIADVTDKDEVVRLSAATYEGVGYVHQGWLTEDHRYFLLGDERDELDSDHDTRTYIFDVQDLHDPELIGIHEGPSDSIDHNQYVKGRYAYQANYEAGLRVLDTDDVGSGELTEVGHFRVIEWPVRQKFRGGWSNYPYFESGVVIVSGIDEGLFILRPNLEDSDDPEDPEDPDAP